MPKRRRPEGLAREASDQQSPKEAVSRDLEPAGDQSSGPTVTVSFRCPRTYAAVLERAGRTKVLQGLVAQWAEDQLADQFVAAYDAQPLGPDEMVESSIPDPW